MPGVDFQRISELVAAREAFINSGPPERRERLRTMQRDIDERLRKGGSKNRLAVAQAMMYDSFHELNRELQAFRSGQELPGAGGATGR